ncbi:MAG: YggS family pyridoxal phosphate-dependent enzyme [Halofilum sp. (in: g-proteobacteria)]
MNERGNAVERDRAAVQAALADVERRIDAACERAGRDRAGVSLLPVTKTVPPERVAWAIEAGYRTLAENRVQDAAAKAEALAGYGVNWHLIGHLQRNKVKRALGVAACIQTLDRSSLVERLADQLAARGERREVLMQVNTSGAASQFGVAPAEATDLAAIIAERPELEWTGLMTIGRFSDEPEDTRDCFQALRRLRDDLQDRFGQVLPVLSMGMSGDLEVAVEEGATLVRVGSAVFGARG